MTEQQRQPALDVPDPAKIEKRGVSIKAPAPVDFSIPDPWGPSANGAPEPHAHTGHSGEAAAPGDSE